MSEKKRHFGRPKGLTFDRRHIRGYIKDGPHLTCYGEHGENRMVKFTIITYRNRGRKNSVPVRNFFSAFYEMDRDQDDLPLYIFDKFKTGSLIEVEAHLEGQCFIKDGVKQYRQEWRIDKVARASEYEGDDVDLAGINEEDLWDGDTGDV